MTAPRAEYLHSKGQIEVGHTGRGKTRKPIMADAVATVAVNVDCATCGCIAVENRQTVQTPPPARMRLRLPRHMAHRPSGSHLK